jgi:alkylation response protein AidB-like acyl-CoA dehydrogenase
VDFELSPDQVALREAARGLLDKLATSERVRSADGFDDELWREMVVQGWPALAVPEPAGGLGLGFVEVAVLAEEVGRHVAPAPYLSTALALHALTAAGADEPAARLLDGGIGAVGRANAPIPDLPVADVAVVLDGDAVIACELGEHRPERLDTLDVTRRTGRLDPATVAGGTRLGGAELARDLVDRAAVGLSAELLGAAERMLEVSVAYAKVREQFGRPIGSFQAVKHRCADMYVDVEGMRSATYYAAWALATGAPDGSLAASTAKAWCAEAGPRVQASALQVHGGIGFTWEHDLHLYLKRTQLSARLLGDAAWHRERVIALLRQRVEGGEALF